MRENSTAWGSISCPGDLFFILFLRARRASQALLLLLLLQIEAAAAGLDVLERVSIFGSDERFHARETGHRLITDAVG